jgi:hypothetical protein
MAYTAEPIPGLIVKTLLDTEWDVTLQQKIPKPNIHEVGEEIRVDLKLGDTAKDWVEIAVTPAGEREMWRAEWEYADITVEIQMKISTASSHQRLYDIKQQIRRIIRVNKHNRKYLGTEYQALRYVRFIENITGKVKNWEGTCFCQMEAAGVLMETS